MITTILVALALGAFTLYTGYTVYRWFVRVNSSGHRQGASFASLLAPFIPMLAFLKFHALLGISDAQAVPVFIFLSLTTLVGIVWGAAAGNRGSQK